MSSINILAMSDECNLEQLCYPAGIMLKNRSRTDDIHDSQELIVLFLVGQG